MSMQHIDHISNNHDQFVSIIGGTICSIGAALWQVGINEVDLIFFIKTIIAGIIGATVSFWISRFWKWVVKLFNNTPR